MDEDIDELLTKAANEYIAAYGPKAAAAEGSSGETGRS
jgi:ribosomal protein L12E/L44/L45/RPP1/RPP2